MTLGEDLKHFRPRARQVARLRIAMYIAVLAILVLIVHTMSFHAEVASEKARAEFVPMWKRIRMPPAVPIYESPVELLRLTTPVPCVRLEGEHRGMGREWIRSWGDGELPPATPTCVRATLTMEPV